MKLNITTLLVAALTATANASISAKEAGDENRCNKRNPHVVEAIWKLCQSSSDTVVPPALAHTGGPEDTHVYVISSCSPAQWVLSDICVNQFMHQCANAQKGSKGDSTVISTRTSDRPSLR